MLLLFIFFSKNMCRNRRQNHLFLVSYTYTCLCAKKKNLIHSRSNNNNNL